MHLIYRRNAVILSLSPSSVSLGNGKTEMTRKTVSSREFINRLN